MAAGAAAYRWTCSAAAATLLVLAPALVAAQAFFNMESGLFGTLIGVGCHAFRFELGARIQVPDAFGAKAEAILAHSGMPGIAAAEIFRGRLGHTANDALLESGANIDVSSRNAQRHLTCLLVRTRCPPAHFQTDSNI